MQYTHRQGSDGAVVLADSFDTTLLVIETTLVWESIIVGMLDARSMYRSLGFFCHESREYRSDDVLPHEPDSGASAMM